MLFNSVSDKYRVVIEDYGAYYSETEGGVVWPQLDAALVSSDPPDMLDLQFMNIHKYVRQGALEDLEPYLEASSRLNKEDFLDNMLEGMTLGGRLVCIPQSFKIEVAAGRSSQTDKLDSWTMEDVYRLEELYSEEVSISDGCGGGVEREYLLEKFCSAYYLEQFVDWERGECSFDNEEFSRLLKWVEEHEGKPGGVILPGGSTVSRDDYVSEGEFLVANYGLDFTSLLALEIQCGEEMRLLGVPSADGQGRFQARVFDAVAITANSTQKDGAWEFLEYFIAVNLSGQSSSFLPTNKKVLQKLYKNEVTPLYIDGGSGEDEPQMKPKSTIFRIGEDEFPYYFTPREQADAIMEIIDRADFSPLTEAEETIIQIIVEESAAYYSGDRKLEDVTEKIQNRAQLLLDEITGVR